MTSNIANNKILGFITTFVIIFTLLLSFHTVSAAPPLVPDCGTVTSTTNSDGTITKSINNPCDFTYLMTLANNVINFLLFIVATPLVAMILCYAGFLLLTSGGSSENVTKAKHIIMNVVIGYIIALAAWLIIHTILSALGFNGPMFLK
ncbi:MAG: hypothetical protein KGI58_03465 [Patescibacteria group bacterium]|nr:hypothetical protein [Patescibacteria group bacterium]